MEEIKFIHRVSKGTRFNQIYLPKSMQDLFEVGDIVEVKLIEKKSKLYFSKNLNLSGFKEKLAGEILGFLSQFRGIEQSFIFGSFLSSSEYADIDILIITDKNLEKEIYGLLTEKYGMKFHIILIPKLRFDFLSLSCPLTRSMLSSFVSDKEFKLPKQTILDKSHIQFLLMMPKDILSVQVSSKVLYDNLRRLIAIEEFLEDKEITAEKISKEIIRILGEETYLAIKAGEILKKEKLEKIRKLFKLKIRNIEAKLGKK